MVLRWNNVSKRPGHCNIGKNVLQGWVLLFGERSKRLRFVQPNVSHQRFDFRGILFQFAPIEWIEIVHAEE